VISYQDPLQPEDGDSLVRGVQVRVATHFGHGFQEGQHRVTEDRKVLAGDEILDGTFLLAQPERFV
jgi:hypothetical protein